MMKRNADRERLTAGEDRARPWEGGRRGPRADASERTAAGCVRGSAWPPKVRTAALARASVEGKGPKGRGRRQSRVRTRRGPGRCF